MKYVSILLDVSYNSQPIFSVAKDIINSFVQAHGDRITFNLSVFSDEIKAVFYGKPYIKVEDRHFIGSNSRVFDSFYQFLIGLPSGSNEVILISDLRDNGSKQYHQVDVQRALKLEPDYNITLLCPITSEHQANKLGIQKVMFQEKTFGKSFIETLTAAIV